MGVSYVFSLRHQVNASFKSNQLENSCNVAVTNCGENPYKKPVKKLISSKVEAVVL